jgi:hypothetical protein
MACGTLPPAATDPSEPDDCWTSTTGTHQALDICLTLWVYAAVATWESRHELLSATADAPELAGPSGPIPTFAVFALPGRPRQPHWCLFVAPDTCSPEQLSSTFCACPLFPDWDGFSESASRTSRHRLFDTARSSALIWCQGKTRHAMSTLVRPQRTVVTTDCHPAICANPHGEGSASAEATAAPTRLNRWCDVFEDGVTVRTYIAARLELGDIRRPALSALDGLERHQPSVTWMWLSSDRPTSVANLSAVTETAERYTLAVDGRLALRLTVSRSPQANEAGRPSPAA